MFIIGNAMHRVYRLFSDWYFWGIQNAREFLKFQNIERSYEEFRQELRLQVIAGNREESDRLLKEFQRRFPVPSAHIVLKEEWATKTDHLIVATHQREDISQAIRNVTMTGRKLTRDEEKQLEKISFHWCSWSPTGTAHRNDSWMRFLKYSHPDLKDLQPILDSLIWQNEIELYPLGSVPRPPWLFLLATPTKFYVYNFQDNAMLKAGDTLGDVIDGMREERWRGEWPQLPTMKDEDPDDYFPVYDASPHSAGSHPLQQPVKDFKLKYQEL